MGGIAISRLAEIREIFTTGARSRVARNALTLWGGQLANFSLGFLSLTLYGILFSKPQIAIINLFEMVVALFVSVGFSWSAIALVRFGEEEHRRDGSLSYTSSVRLALIAPILAVLCVAVLVFRSSLLGFIGASDASLAAFVVVDLLLVVAREHLANLFNASERHPVNASVYFGMSVGKLSVLLLLWNGVWVVSAETYVKLLVGVDGLAVAAQLAFVKKRYLLPFQKPRRSDFSRMARFVLPQIYGFAALYMINWIDAYFIRLHLSRDALGGYQFVYTLFTRAAALSLILNTVFFPRILEWNRSNPDAVMRYVRNAPLIVVGAAGLLASAVIVLIAPVFSILFGPKFSDFYPSFRLLLAAVPWVFLSYVYVPVLNARDRVAMVQLSTALAAVVNVGVDYLLVERVGVIGAALGTLLALQVRSLTLMVAAHRMVGVGCLRLAGATVLLGLLAVVHVVITTGVG